MLEPKNCSSNTSSSFITPVASTYVRVAEVGDVQGGGVRRWQGVGGSTRARCNTGVNCTGIRLSWRLLHSAAKLHRWLFVLLKLTISDPRSQLFTINTTPCRKWVSFPVPYAAGRAPKIWLAHEYRLRVPDLRDEAVHEESTNHISLQRMRYY